MRRRTKEILSKYLPENLDLIRESLITAMEQKINIHENEIDWIDEAKAWKIKGKQGKYLRHWVEINSSPYPQKWVFNILFNINEKFHQHDAEDFFMELDLKIGTY